MKAKKIPQELLYSFDIDPHKGEIRSKHTGKLVGSYAYGGYCRVGFKGKTYSAHRIMWLYVHEYEPNEVDHINGDNSDNRIENLREATRAQNNRNRGIQINNTSGVPGVCWSKAAKKWQAKLKVNSKVMYFGHYDDLELAALVISEAREKYHGEFARHS